MIKHAEEFKEKAINLGLDHGYNQVEAANSLQINHKNINYWIFKAKSI